MLPDKDLLEKYKQKMIEAAHCNGDEEMAHMAADKVLLELILELGYDEVAALFEAIPKWYA